MISRIATLFPRLVTLLMVAMIAAPGAMTRDAAAQQSTATQTSFTSALSDMTVDVAGDFQISTSDSGTYDTGAGETVTIDNGAVRVMIGFFDDTDDPETTIGLYSDGFASDFGDVTELDSGTTRGVFWNVSRAGDANDETIFYISVTSDVVGNVDVMTLMWGPESDFIGSLEDAQYDVTIDGDGIFAEADIDSLEAAIGGNGESATGTEGTGSGSSITKGGQGTTGSGTKPDATATETTASQGGTSGDVLTSEVTGIEIELGGDWTVQSSDVSDEGRLPEEIIQLQSGYANGYIVFSYDVDAQSARDSFLGGFDTSAQSRDTLAKDEESDRAWSLDHAILGDGTEVYVYVEVRAGIDPDYLVLSTILAKPADFMDEFTSAQDNILLDGESIFPDTDADEIEALITGGGQGTTQEQPTEVATATSGGENPRDHAKLPGKSGDDEIDSGNETETGATGTAATTDFDFSDVGLISDSEYESPQFGVDVTWGPSWYVDLSDEDAVVSDASSETDTLTLTWDGVDYALLFVDVFAADGYVPADYVDYWASDDFLEDGELLMQRTRQNSGAIIMRDHTDSGLEVIIVKEAILLDDGNMGVMTLISVPDNFADLYADGQDGVELASGPILNTFTLRQLERALDQ